MEKGVILKVISIVFTLITILAIACAITGSGSGFLDLSNIARAVCIGVAVICGEELFVADCDGVLAGCIMLCQADDPSVGQLRLFAVEKDYRRYGIGSALIAAFMQKAKDSGYQKIILWTASPLTDAIRHYEKLGFKATESVENATWNTDGKSG